MVYSTRRFVVCLTLCHFVLVFFSPFSIAMTSLWEKRANLSAFRTFVRFVLVWICRLPLHSAFRTFVSICACLDLSVSSSSWCLGRAAVCDCGTPWTFFLPFFFVIVGLPGLCSYLFSMLKQRPDFYLEIRGYSR